MTDTTYKPGPAAGGRVRPRGPYGDSGRCFAPCTSANLQMLSTPSRTNAELPQRPLHEALRDWCQAQLGCMSMSMSMSMCMGNVHEHDRMGNKHAAARGCWTHASPGHTLAQLVERHCGNLCLLAGCQLRPSLPHLRKHVHACTRVDPCGTC